MSFCPSPLRGAALVVIAALSVDTAEAAEPRCTPILGLYQSKAWTIEFEGNDFYAVLGPDDWYRGTIRLRPETNPAEIDFLIENCRCDFVGQTSNSIFVWDGAAVRLATPQPGGPRPTAFNVNSGQVVRLERVTQ